MTKSHAIVVLLCGGLLLTWFAPALSGTTSFVFRDAAHFYRPLFEWSRDQWRHGESPLWNPYENGGVSLAAENTASLFYPGQLLFLLPGDAALLFNGYVVLHVALAAVTCFGLARRQGASVLAAGIAAISYAASGSVLFQTTNVVFLVGAAWLPWALNCAQRTLQDGAWRSALLLGLAWALMVTGGDPQMAYNTLLLSALFAWIARRARSRADGAWSVDPIPSARRQVALLAVALAACGSLSAVQILPTLAATRDSVRASHDAPRSIYELAAGLFEKVDGAERAGQPSVAWYSGLLGTVDEGHSRQIYAFSVGPWRFIELLWPNVSGRQFPQHHRWIDAIPAEGRVWTPSLYLGLLPLVLGLSQWSLRRKVSADARWDAWMVALGVLGSLGVFGIGWGARELAGLLGHPGSVQVGDEVGGLYWLLTVLLPGYGYFRYPAKLFVIATLGLSLLAARGWDALEPWPCMRVLRMLDGLFALSLVLAGCVVLAWPRLETWLGAVPPDPLFGPLQLDGARHDLLCGLLHTAVCALVLRLLIYRRNAQLARGWTGVALLAVTTVELAVAQPWLLPMAPSRLWRTEPEVVAQLPADRSNYRVERRVRIPQRWSETSSPDRLSECLRWERSTLTPKYELPYGVAMIEASGSLASADYQMVLDLGRVAGQGGEPSTYTSALLDLLGVRAVIETHEPPPAKRGTANQQQAASRNDPTAHVTLRDTALPRAWIVHRVETLAPLENPSRSALRERTREVLFSSGPPRDWRQVAVIETNELPLKETGPPAAAGERCEITRAEPSCVEIAVRMSAPGLVVLSDRFDPLWQLTVETDGRERNEPLLRTNRVLRGVWLPAGEHRLIYRYRPWTVRWGAIVSGIAVAAGLSMLARDGLRRLRRVRRGSAAQRL